MTPNYFPIRTPPSKLRARDSIMYPPEHRNAPYPRFPNGGKTTARLRQTRPDDEKDTLEQTTMPYPLSSNFLNDKYSDMTIICKGQAFACHRVVLCTESAFFDRMMKTPSDNRTPGIKNWICSLFSVPAQIQPVHLPEDDPEIVKRFLQFTYTRDYSFDIKYPNASTQVDDASHKARITAEGDDEQSRISFSIMTKSTEEDVINLDAEQDDDDNASLEDVDEDKILGDMHSHRGNLHPVDEPHNRLPGNDDNEGSDMLVHVRLHILAEKLEAQALRELSRKRFQRIAESCWRRLPAHFARVCDEIYEHTKPYGELDGAKNALRDIVCRLTSCGVEMRNKGEWKEQSEYQMFMDCLKPVMNKHGEFATGVMEHIMDIKSGDPRQVSDVFKSA